MAFKITSSDEEKTAFINNVNHFITAINDLTGGGYEELEKDFHKKLEKTTGEPHLCNYLLASYYACSAGTRDIFNKNIPRGLTLDKKTDKCKTPDINRINPNLCGICLYEFKRGERLLQIVKCDHLIHERCLTYEVIDCGTYKKLKTHEQHPIDCIICHCLYGAPILDMSIVKVE